MEDSLKPSNKETYLYFFHLEKASLKYVMPMLLYYRCVGVNWQVHKPYCEGHAI